MNPQNKITKALALAALLMIVCTGLSTANAANPTQGNVVSNLVIPFNHTAAVTLGDTSELVDFTGNIHMLVTVSFPNDPILPPNPIRIHTNVMNVSGIGQTSGTTYRLSGPASFSFPFSNSFSFATSYRLQPSPPPIREVRGGPPIRDLSFNVGYLISLDSTGRVTGAEAFPTIIEE